MALKGWKKLSLEHKASFLASSSKEAIYSPKEQDRCGGDSTSEDRRDLQVVSREKDMSGKWDVFYALCMDMVNCIHLMA